MWLPQLEYYEPETIKEASAKLVEEKNLRLMAGGTDLIPSLRQLNATRTKGIVNLKRIKGLDTLSYDGKQGLRIGALVTIDTLANAAVVKEKFAVLAEAASRVASPQIRNVGTIGGNVCVDVRCSYLNEAPQWGKAIETCFKRDGDMCHIVKGGGQCYAFFSSDIVPALIACDAEVKVFNIKGERTVRLDEFYTGEGQNWIKLASGDIVTEIHVPNPPANTGGAYFKHAIREAIDFPIVGVAAVVTLGEDKKTLQSVRIGITGATSAPIKPREAEKLLAGKEPTEELLNKAGEAAGKEAQPVSVVDMPAVYKRKVIKALVKRAVIKASSRAAHREV